MNASPPTLQQPAAPSSSSSNGCLKGALIGCGSLFALSVIGVIGFFVWLGFQPEGGVRMANEMEDYAVAYLEEQALLNEGEQLMAYYDVTLGLDGTEAIILTDQRLLHHRADRDDISVPLTEIEGFSHYEESIIGDVFEVEVADGSILKFEIALFNDGPIFKSALERQLERVGSAESPEPL